MLLYVDDELIASKRKIEVERTKHQLSKEFEMELSEARKILGMEIRRDKFAGKVWLIESILAEGGKQVQS